jgi:hypothetical protein
MAAVLCGLSLIFDVDFVVKKSIISAIFIKLLIIREQLNGLSNKLQLVKVKKEAKDQ